nr:iron-siderophore ABC transporter substrate-binding protein [Longirhabdus pacifica]
MNLLKRNKAVLLFTLLMSVMLVLSACGQGEDNKEEDKAAATESEEAASTENEETAVEEETEMTESEAESYSITHAMGTTDIQGQPQRIVILTNEGTEALLAMGIKPVGAVRSWLGDPWYAHIEEEMDGVVNVGLESEPSIEDIIALQPDLIIGNKQRQEKIYDQLSEIAPTVFSEKLKGDWQDNLALYAEAVGQKEMGEEVIAAYFERIEDFKSKAGDQLDKEVSIVRFLPGTARMYQKQSFSGVILEQIGFARPASQDVDDFMVEVSKESIPNMDAEMLFYFTYDAGDGTGNQTEAEWLADPLWNNLEVVKAGNAYKVSDAIWNTAGGVLAANEMLDELYTFYDIELN